MVRTGTAAPNSALGYDFPTTATQISWRVQSNIAVDMYLVTPTNFNLMKNGQPFNFEWSALNAVDVTGPTYSNSVMISNTLIIAIFNKNSIFSASATFTLNSYGSSVVVGAGGVALYIIGSIIGSICFCCCIIACCFIICRSYIRNNNGGTVYYDNGYSRVPIDPNLQGQTVLYDSGYGGTTIIDGQGYNTGYGNTNNSYGIGYTNTPNYGDSQGGNQYR